jgi:TatA/E family protein of Tat protein translocase
MGALSPLHLVIILVIALLVIGPGKLPEVGSALGKSIGEFRRAVSDVQESVKLDGPVAPAVPAPAQPASVTPAVAMPAPALAAPIVPALAPNTVAVAATRNELGTPVAPDLAATAADAATEARV